MKAPHPRRRLPLAALLLAPLSWAAPGIEPGNWEITTKMEMEGAPFAMPPQTHTQCITQEDMAAGMITTEVDQCTVKERKTAGNTLTWRVQCKSRAATTDSESTITAAGKHRYTGVMQTQTTSRDGAVTRMTSRVDGRYIGPCTRAPKPAKKPDDY